jgi:DNA-binding NarL/FixJ family response regulator
VNAQLLAKLRREYVREAIRDGKTIAQIQAEYAGVSKRFIEDERKALAAIDGSVPDARSKGVRQEVERLIDQGVRVVEIAAALKISPSAVYHHRRKIKKVK